ncbi:MAG: DUF58 domain-containing protein [Actinomycetota bacterium]|nr:DUF58 domain-containing protein [Actinomycetota bacterium]
MPTGRGWVVACTGLVVLLLGVVFGNQPLQQLGFGLMALVGLALLVVRRGRFSLSATRSVSPARARPQQQVAVELVLTNKGRGAAPMLLLEERLPPGLAGHTRFGLHGIEPGGHREASMQVTPARRGRYSVGPLQISVIDPFGLARTTSEAAPASPLLVHPPVEALGLPREQGERRSMSQASLRRLSGGRGEDFYTMREYVEGDDLRKVHWASTAKRGRFMIRQEETPWHTRATVVLDDRAGPYEGRATSSSFERAVSAAASLLDLYCRSGYGFALVTAHSLGLPSGRGTDHLNRGLDLLATLELRDSASADDAFLLRVRELEGASAHEAALVVITGAVGAAEALAVSRCSARFKQVSVVSFPAHRFGQLGTRARWEGEQKTLEAARLMGRARVRSVVLGPDESLAAAWGGSPRTGARKEVAWGARTELV